MTIILYNPKMCEKTEVEETMKVEEAAMNLGLGSVQANRAKFSVDGRELQRRSSFAEQGVKPGETVRVVY